MRRSEFALDYSIKLSTEPASLIERIRELESRLEESEETLDAIRRGEVDALVVGGIVKEHRVYTLESADRPYQVLIEQIQEGAVTLSEDGTVLYCNRRLSSLLEVAQERVIGRKLAPFVMKPGEAAFARLLDDARHAGARCELTLCTSSGRAIPVYISLNMLQRDGAATLLCGIVTDLTEQKFHIDELAEVNNRLVTEIAERERVEDALRQSQKMEAVGQLTGGLAHDFNNLLTGIVGNLELLQDRVVKGRLDGLDRYVSAAQGAAGRAAALTHRLLAFSRRQILDPVSTDASQLIAGMVEFIQRTVGPAIAVETVFSAGLWPTLCDPNQLENAVLNLAINARDAMPDGGRLMLKTSNMWVDERSARERDMTAGAYVAVSVSDTGVGMAPEVVARAFDPFFTTKPIGSGTGLGLSMIYGFARQSAGQTRIYSTPGKGTTVRLYLPHYTGQETRKSAQVEVAAPLPAETMETVLIVDDEPAVRTLVAEVLSGLGYAVLEAADGSAGLGILQSDVRIDLLITDVGLPGLNGRQVADAARERRSNLPILFITGYADNAAMSNGSLERGMQIMTKPFSLIGLANKVRAMLLQ